MKKLTDDELNELYYKLFPLQMSYGEFSDKLSSMNSPYINELRDKFCSEILDVSIRGFYRWNDAFRDYISSNLLGLFIEHTNRLEDMGDYYKSVVAFFSGDFSSSLKSLDKYLKSMDIISMYIIDYVIFPVFKNAFPGFWQHIKEITKNMKCENGVYEFIDAIETYYNRADFEVLTEKFSSVLMINNNVVSAKELLTRVYIKNKMWKNAISYYEQIDVPYTLSDSDLYFAMAWAYSKVNETDNAIAYYKKCLEISPKYSFANNNLAYAYIKIKKYSDAIDILENCLTSDFGDVEIKYASNNLVLAYIGANKIEQAEIFVSKCKIKLWKATIDKLEQSKNKELPLDNIDIVSDDKQEHIRFSKADTDLKFQQFSSEKILEDELLLRIEAGQPVFGKPLKIFRRKGEYGRQYIIPVGRLDLLAEDSNGNLYVIELKKDSGYDDPYKQISVYLDWFEKNKLKPNQKVYGIICLNNPSAKLIKQVKADNRVKLYEYTIAYNEVK